MFDQNNKPVELGPIALELMKLSEELRVFSLKPPLFAPHNIENDDAPPMQEQAGKLHD